MLLKKVGDNFFMGKEVFVFLVIKSFLLVKKVFVTKKCFLVKSFIGKPFFGETSLKVKKVLDKKNYF